MRLVCAGEAREVDDELWRILAGPKPPEGFECDGCSSSPDSFLGTALWPACAIHDYHYREGVLGGTWHARRIADRYLRLNIERLLIADGKWGWVARSVARTYYGRVRVWGARAYRHWDVSEAPLRFAQRVREVWGHWEPRREAVEQTARKALGFTE